MSFLMQLKEHVFKILGKNTGYARVLYNRNGKRGARVAEINT